jgi:hypothetical protein
LRARRCDQITSRDGVSFLAMTTEGPDRLGALLWGA